MRREPGALVPLVVRETVCLVEDHDQVARVCRDRLREGDLLSRHRRIRADDDDRRVHVRDELARDRRVATERRSEARRVHEAHPAGEERARQEHLDRADALPVLRVLPLGHVRGQRLDGDVLRAPVLEADVRAARAVPKHGDRGRDRNDSRWEHRLSHERVEERGLSALELSDDRHVEATLRHAGGDLGSIARQVSGSELTGKIGELAEPRGGVGCRVLVAREVHRSHRARRCMISHVPLRGGARYEKSSYGPAVAS